MTTLYALALAACGLSDGGAARLHKVRADTIKDWRTGRREAPPHALATVHEFADRLTEEAEDDADKITAQIMAAVEATRQLPEAIELGYAADDHEARDLGWPCAGAHVTLMLRTWEALPVELAERCILVPRGSTSATAGAIDDGERQHG